MVRNKPNFWIHCFVVLTILAFANDLFGQFAYVASENGVLGYAINPTTGTLTPIPGSPFATGTYSTFVTVDPTGKFAYVAHVGPNTVSGYTVNPSTGALTPIPGLLLSYPINPLAVVIHPTGKFAYVPICCGGGEDAVKGYTINATTGALTPIPGWAFPQLQSGPWSMALDPTGKFAYVANAAEDSVTAYTVDATTGNLTPIPGQPFPTGSGPFFLAVDPTGRFVYTANSYSRNVSGYAINPTTGTLTPIPGSPFATGTLPSSVTVDPTGRFVYSGNSEICPQTVSGFTINATSGALTLIPGSPFAVAGMEPLSVAVDPTGKFFYTAGGEVSDCSESGVDGRVSAYTINAGTGALTPVPGSPFATGPWPESIAFSPLNTIRLSALYLDFGYQAPGTTSPPQKVTVTNTTLKPVTISSIVTSGDFAESNDCGSSLAVGAFCTISVTFTPTETGARTGILTISDSAPGSPHEVMLSGTGTGGPPAANLSPTSLTFATQFIGTTSGPKTVVLKNTGDLALNITRIVMSGADFAQSNNCGASLAGGASCTFNITFKPILKWRRTGGLYLYDNAPGSPQKVALDGQGTVITLAPASLNFGNQIVGTTSAPQTLTLTNTSSTPLSLWCTEIATGNNEDFAQTNTCGTGIGAGASCTIRVTFKPRYKGTRTSQFRAHGDGGGTPWTVSVTGNGATLTLPGQPAK